MEPDLEPKLRWRRNIVENPVWSPLSFLPGLSLLGTCIEYGSCQLSSLLGPKPSHSSHCIYLTCLICKTIAYSTLWNIINLSVHKSQAGISEEFLADPPRNMANLDVRRISWVSSQPRTLTLHPYSRGMQSFCRVGQSSGKGQCYYYVF